MHTTAEKKHIQINKHTHTHTQDEDVQLFPTVHTHWSTVKTLLCEEMMSFVRIGQHLTPAHTTLENCSVFPGNDADRGSWHFTCQCTEGSWPSLTPLTLFPQRSRLTWGISSVASWEGSRSCSTLEAVAEKISLGRQKKINNTCTNKSNINYIFGKCGVLGLLAHCYVAAKAFEMFLAC